MQSIEVNKFVFNVSELRYLENVLHFVVWGMIIYNAFLALLFLFKELLYIFGKAYNYFVYENDFLDKIPSKRNQIIVINDSSEHCLESNHDFVYDNDFLKKYPIKKNKVIVINDSSEHCLESNHDFVYDNDFLKKYPIKKNVIVINDSSELGLKDVINELMNGNPPEFNVVGLDCEISSDTTNQGRPCPALLQVARPDGYCVIFQLKHIKKVHSIMNILNNRETLLVGVGILNDVNNLNNVGWDLRSQRCLDIRHLADNLGYEHPLTLKALASKVLKRNCKKKLKRVKWEAFRLTEEQKKYASEDALLSVEIFMNLNNQKICQSFGKREWFSWSEETYWRHTLTLWKEFIGKTFDPPQANIVSNITFLSDCLPSNGFISTQKYRLQGNRPPRIVELEKHRFCVVCGLKDEREISLKAIVPLEYRVEFCLDLHYYLDLCKCCIIKNQKEDFIFRNYLADVYGAPYPIYMTEELLSLKRLSKTILENKNRMDNPDTYTYINFLFERLCAQLSIAAEDCTIRDIEVISNMDCWPYSSHGDTVWRYFATDTKKLGRMWCYRFIETMKPLFLPESSEMFYRKNCY